MSVQALAAALWRVDLVLYGGLLGFVGGNCVLRVVTGHLSGREPFQLDLDDFEQVGMLGLPVGVAMIVVAILHPPGSGSILDLIIGLICFVLGVIGDICLLAAFVIQRRRAAQRPSPRIPPQVVNDS